MTIGEVNLLAVLAAAAIGYGAGALWYAVLGTQWMRALGKSREELPRPPGPFIIAGLANLVIAAVLGVFVELLGGDAARGLAVALLAWLGFVLPVMAMNAAFAGHAWRLVAIDAGHAFVALALMGLVLGLWA